MKIYEVRNLSTTIQESEPVIHENMVDEALFGDPNVYSPSLKQRWQGRKRDKSIDQLIKKAFASWQDHLNQVRRSLPPQYNGAIPPERLRHDLEAFIQTNIMRGQQIAKVHNAQDIEHYITALTGLEAPTSRYAADDEGNFIRSIPGLEFIRLNVDPAILYYPPFDQRYVLNNNGEWVFWGKKTSKAPELESVQGYLDQAKDAFDQADLQQKQQQSVATPQTTGQQPPTPALREDLRQLIANGDITLVEAKKIYRTIKNQWLNEEQEKLTLKKEKELFGQLVRTALLARPSDGSAPPQPQRATAGAKPPEATPTAASPAPAAVTRHAPAQVRRTHTQWADEHLPNIHPVATETVYSTGNPFADAALKKLGFKPS